MKFSSREEGIHLHSPPAFTDEVLSKERQLMKWVGVFQVEIFWLGIPSGDFLWGGAGA